MTNSRRTAIARNFLAIPTVVLHIHPRLEIQRLGAPRRTNALIPLPISGIHTEQPRFIQINDIGKAFLQRHIGRHGNHPPFTIIRAHPHLGDDGRLRNWTYPDANNFLRATLEVNQVPSSGKVVIGQIHAYDSQKPLIKLEYQFKEKTQTGNIVAKVRMRPDDGEGRVITVASNVPLEKSFTYVINLNKAGLLSVYAADGEWNERIGAAWGAKPLYFKAGAYVQDNSGDSKEGARVTFAKLDIDHD